MYNRFVGPTGAWMATGFDAFQQWRECADDMRTLASQIYDEDSRQAVLRIADEYDRLVARLELRSKTTTIH
jgi:hypothetical protein